MVVPMTWSERVALKEDLIGLNAEATGIGLSVSMPKGTILNKIVYRRVAESAHPFEVWCEPYSYKYGFNRDIPGWNIVCLQKTNDGRTAFYFQPHPIVYYTNGTSQTVHYSQPPNYASKLISGYKSDHLFPEFEPVDETINKPVPIHLQLHIGPPSDAKLKKGWLEKFLIGSAHSAISHWAMFFPNSYNGEKLRRENTREVDQAVRLRLKDVILQAPYDYEKNMYGSVTLDKVQEGDLELSQPYPIDYAPAASGVEGYYLYLGPISDSYKPVIDEPWHIGALKLKPETITLKQGALKKDETFLTIKATRTDRLRLTKAPPVLKDNVFRFKEGDYVYEWKRVAYQPDGTPYLERFLCGTGQAFYNDKSSDDQLCVPTSAYNKLGMNKAGIWDIEPYGYDFWVGTQPISTYDYETVLDPDPDPEEKLLEIKVDGDDPNFVELRLGLKVNNKFVGSKRLRRYVSNDGYASFYLWDKVIKLKRNGKLTTAEIMDSDKRVGPYYSDK